ncbi:MAG: lytic murein transglycosylase [Rhizobiaceae bacterium]|nr:lytic murein transglycosylase [Rhizobiaceae bacterium]
MTFQWNFSGKFKAAAFALLIASSASVGEVRADAGFQKWIRDFYSVAAKSGISRNTYNAVFKGVTSPDPAVIKSANFQPEFKSKVWDYMDNRVTESAIEKGLEMKVKYKRWLDIIEKRYGVDRHILLAIWSMETSYGAALVREGALRNVARSLATLAYQDKRRRKFARSQLIAAMKIVQNGDVSASGLRGSWAGAMGHTQFIPTSYLTWAQDIDGDGRRNIWESVPDALASAANLLKKNGWRTGKTWGYEVKTPAGFKKERVGTNSRTLAEWQRMGIRRVNGKAFPRPSDKANIKILAGSKGPAFLMLKNFFVLKSYNNADKYALAVGHLADQLRGFGPFVVDWPRGYIKLDEEERKELQERLKRLGFYEGEIDGKIGSGSRGAIKDYQRKFGLAQDGYASKRVLASLRKR